MGVVSNIGMVHLLLFLVWGLKRFLFFPSKRLMIPHPSHSQFCREIWIWTRNYEMMSFEHVLGAWSDLILESVWYSFDILWIMVKVFKGCVVIHDDFLWTAEAFGYFRACKHVRGPTEIRPSDATQTYNHCRRRKKHRPPTNTRMSQEARING